MNIRDKLLQLQRGVKRQRIEESEDETDVNAVHGDGEEAPMQNEENGENIDPEIEQAELEEEEELIPFEIGTTNKGGRCLWHKG